MTGGTHVVFGSGPAGRAVSTALADQGARVRTVNRSGIATVGGADTADGETTDPAFASWDDIVASTVDRYRTPAATTAVSAGLAEATTQKVTS
jgi:hypothetical protein